MSDPAYQLLLTRNSLLVSGLGACLALLAAAILVACSLVVGGRLGRSILYVSSTFLLVPTYALAGAWSTSGVAGGWWSISPVDVAGSPWKAIAAVVWIHATAKLPINVLALVMAVQRLGRPLFEQSMLEYGWRKTATQILWPTLRPWIFFILAINMLLIHSDMVISNLYQVETLTERVYLNNQLGIEDPTATVICLSYAVALAALALVAIHASWLNFRRSQSGHASWWQYDHAVKPQRWLALGIATFLLFMYVGVPTTKLIYKSGFALKAGAAMNTWAFDPARAVQSVLRSPWEFQEEFRWTIELACWAAAAAVVLAAIAIMIAERWRWAATGIAILALVAISLPGPIINRLAIMIFNRPDGWLDSIYSDSLLVCILCLQFRVWPVALLIMWPSWIALRNRYQDAWKLDFPQGLTFWWQAIRPAFWKPFAMTFLVAGTVAVGDLSSYLLVLPPGVTTVAMRVFDLLHYAVRYRESGLLVLLCILGSGLSWMVLRRFVL